METNIYLATAQGLNMIAGLDGSWHGDVRLQGKQVQCVASGMQPKRVYCGTFGAGSPESK